MVDPMKRRTFLGAVFGAIIGVLWPWKPKNNNVEAVMALVEVLRGVDGTIVHSTNCTIVLDYIPPEFKPGAKVMLSGQGGKAEIMEIISVANG